jgi:hypothetical protein
VGRKLAQLTPCARVRFSHARSRPDGLGPHDRDSCLTLLTPPLPVGPRLPVVVSTDMADLAADGACVLAMTVPLSARTRSPI